MSFVYFIKPVGMDGPIKVGCSYAPEGRRKTLDTWSPFALEIVAEIEGGFDLERRFHALFAETHQRREWFGWSRRIAAVIEAINEGSFNIETLPAPIIVANRDRSGRGTRAKEWNPARRFSVAYRSRLYALLRRGMPREEGRAGPSFIAYAYSEHAYASRHTKYADLVSTVRECEAFADAMTAKYGHAALKPVRWVGPFPDDAPSTPKQGQAA